MQKNNIILFAILLISPVWFFLIWSVMDFSDFRWDAAWYRQISAVGYSFNGNILEQNNVAFLPGYPVLVYVLSIFLPIDLAYMQFIASVLLYFIGAFCLANYVGNRIGLLEGYVFIFILSFTPYAIYFFNGYSEAAYFAVIGLFFCLSGRGHYRMAALVVSYGLITRPHALILVPILYYFVLSGETGSLGDERRLKLVASIRSIINVTPFVCVFPAVLTVYYYLFFEDTLLYKNAITAWEVHATGLSQSETLWLSIDSFRHLTTGTIEVAGVMLKYFEPTKFSGLVFLLNILAIIFMARYLIKRNLLSIFLYLVFAALFGFITASIENFGRHNLFLMALPLFMSVILAMGGRQIFLDDGKVVGGAEKAGKIIIGAFALLFFVVLFYHFTIYAALQLKDQWVS
ncbi:MAG: hypothetical protein IT487_13655 [Chromatiaceae bacterium]|nr:hypothetical protein [Chromatiaceae bacterium]